MNISRRATPDLLFTIFYFFGGLLFSIEMFGFANDELMENEIATMEQINKEVSNLSQLKKKKRRLEKQIVETDGMLRRQEIIVDDLLKKSPKEVREVLSKYELYPIECRFEILDLDDD